MDLLVVCEKTRSNGTVYTSAKAGAALAWCGCQLGCPTWVHIGATWPYVMEALSVLSWLCICDVGVLWPNGWMDQDETWHGGRPRLQPRLRWGPSSPKEAQLCPFLGWLVGSPSNTMSSGLRPTSIPSGILIHPAVWPQQTWAENWGAMRLLKGRAGSPSNAVWPGPRPTPIPSAILIHPTIWPQYTNVTDRTSQTDNGLIG